MPIASPERDVGRGRATFRDPRACFESSDRAFHEGFADIVALLSIFAVPRVMRASIEKVAKTGRPVNAAWLKESALLGIAEELGSELSPSLGRAEALRRSITIEPDPRLLSDPAHQEPHTRGEILVHPVLNAFVDVWSERVKPFVRSGSVTATRLWEEAAEAADHLLTMSIRALDYCPPLDLTFGDYLSALLTSDMVLVPDDSKYGYRDRLRKHFGAWGIAASSKGGLETGAWQGPHHGLRRGQAISTERVHFDSLRTDPDEVFRTLIFDEFGTLRYHVRKRIDNLKHQQEKLEYLWTHRLIDRFGRLGSASALAGVIASLKPDLVIQPWTEHPKAAPDATEPPKDRKALRLEIQSLSARQELAASLVARLKATRTIPRDLDYLAGNNLRNVSAVENLMRMGKKGKAEYVYSGFKTDLSKLLPGVKVHVLGPPTVRQTDTVLKQRQSDQDEFWMLRFKMSRPPSKAVGASLPREKQGTASRVPHHARWFVGQMKNIELAEVRSIVESLDKAMNNTSVILLFEAGSQRLLFPGDAQIENWAYALDPKRGFRKLLEGVTVYKVGHHGSRNATPKTLWNLFKARRSSGGKGLVSLISTMPEVPAA